MTVASGVDPDKLNEVVVPVMVVGFDAYQDGFITIARRAKKRFEQRDWHGAVSDAAERLDLYNRVITRLERGVREVLGDRLDDRWLWAEMKTTYARLIRGRTDHELAGTFFNSVTRRVFGTVGVDHNIEFAGSDFDTVEPATPAFHLRTYQQHDLARLLGAILRDCAFDCDWEDMSRDVSLVAARLRSAIGPTAGAEMIPATFFRRKGAYILGWLISDGIRIPLALSLLNRESGIIVDAVLTDEDDISILFSFARSHFQVDLAPATQLIAYLKRLMPRKPTAELYIALGHHKHGKTELYRDLVRHLQASNEKFVFAPGVHGMVMIVFMLPGYDVVVKVIKDRFPPVKPMTPKDVRQTYRLVFRTERAGRLVEAQEFEHLEFDRERFAPDVIAQFLRDADETVKVTDTQVVIHHAYIERRVTPLDLYLARATDEIARLAVDDYGQAIKDLAANGIFPGELLPKNFGVTRHSRVVCYDYDELSFLSDFTFRTIPAAQFDEDDLAEETWYGVGERDVFPEEIRRFIGLPDRLLSVLDETHPELYTVDFWHEMQERVRRGEIIDLFPYQPALRIQLPAVN